MIQYYPKPEISSSQNDLRKCSYPNQIENLARAQALTKQVEICFGAIIWSVKQNEDRRICYPGGIFPHPTD